MARTVQDWASNFADSDSDEPNITLSANNSGKMVLLPVFDQNGEEILYNNCVHNINM